MKLVMPWSFLYLLLEFTSCPLMYFLYMLIKDDLTLAIIALNNCHDLRKLLTNTPPWPSFDQSLIFTIFLPDLSSFYWWAQDARYDLNLKYHQGPGWSSCVTTHLSNFNLLSCLNVYPLSWCITRHWMCLDPCFVLVILLFMPLPLDNEVDCMKQSQLIYNWALTGFKTPLSLFFSAICVATASAYFGICGLYLDLL